MMEERREHDCTVQGEYALITGSDPAQLAHRNLRHLDLPCRPEEVAQGPRCPGQGRRYL